MLALTFANKEDYDKVQEDDSIDIVGLTSFAPGKSLTMVLNHKDGSKRKRFSTIPIMNSRSAGSRQAGRSMLSGQE